MPLLSFSKPFAWMVANHLVDKNFVGDVVAWWRSIYEMNPSRERSEVDKILDEMYKHSDKKDLTRCKSQTIRSMRKIPFKQGDDLHIYINARQADMLKIGEMKAESVYAVEIRCPAIHRDGYKVKIDGTISSQRMIESLWAEDGFESQEAFFDYFVPNIGDVFEGQIITF